MIIHPIPDRPQKATHNSIGCDQRRNSDPDEFPAIGLRLGDGSEDRTHDRLFKGWLHEGKRCGWWEMWICESTKDSFGRGWVHGSRKRREEGDHVGRKVLGVFVVIDRGEYCDTDYTSQSTAGDGKGTGGTEEEGWYRESKCDDYEDGLALVYLGLSKDKWIKERGDVLGTTVVTAVPIPKRVEKA